MGGAGAGCISCTVVTTGVRRSRIGPRPNREQGDKRLPNGQPSTPCRASSLQQRQLAALLVAQHFGAATTPTRLCGCAATACSSAVSISAERLGRAMLDSKIKRAYSLVKGRRFANHLHLNANQAAQASDSRTISGHYAIRHIRLCVSTELSAHGVERASGNTIEAVIASRDSGRRPAPWRGPGRPACRAAAARASSTGRGQ